MDAVLLTLVLVIAIGVIVWDVLNSLPPVWRWIGFMLVAMALAGLVESFVGSGPTWWPMVAAGAVGVVGLGRRMFRRSAEA